MSGAFINGPAVISGNLDVNGTITYISSSTLQIGDNIIEINYNKAAGNSGMIVYDTTAPFTASMLWNATADRWMAGPYGSESIIILTSDTSSMSVNYAKTSSYSTTLGASLTSSAPDQVRLLASDGGTLSTITINNIASSSYATSASYAFNATSASYALNATSASYVNILNQNVTISGSLNITNGVTGSLLGTASYAAQALTSSYANTSTSASYALNAATASYVNTLFQNLIVSGTISSTGNISAPYLSGSLGIYDGSSAGVIQFSYMSAAKTLAYITPSQSGDLIQYSGSIMVASNLIDGGTF
jgi:hypothetical protein